MAPTNKGRLHNGAKQVALSSSQVSHIPVLLRQGAVYRNKTVKGRSAKFLDAVSAACNTAWQADCPLTLQAFNMCGHLQQGGVLWQNKYGRHWEAMMAQPTL